MILLPPKLIVDTIGHQVLTAAKIRAPSTQRANHAEATGLAAVQFNRFEWMNFKQPKIWGPSQPGQMIWDILPQ